MTKLLCMMLAMVMVLGLAACGQTAAPAATPAPSEEPAPVEETPELNEVDAIKAAGVLTVALSPQTAFNLNRLRRIPTEHTIVQNKSVSI